MLSSMEWRRGFCQPVRAQGPGIRSSREYQGVGVLWSTMGYRYLNMHRPGRRAGQGFAARQPDWVPTSSSSGYFRTGSVRSTKTEHSLRCARLHVSVHLDLETNGWLPLVGERGEAVSEAYFWSTNGLAGLGCRDSALLTGPPAWSRTNPIGTVHSTEYNLEDSFWLM